MFWIIEEDGIWFGYLGRDPPQTPPQLTCLRQDKRICCCLPNTVARNSGAAVQLSVSTLEWIVETTTAESSRKSGTVHDFGAVYMQPALRFKKRYHEEAACNSGEQVFEQ